LKRKEFLQSVLGASAFIGLPLTSCNDQNTLQELVNNTTKKIQGNMIGFSSQEIKKVRIGVIGLGNRGSVLIEMLQYLVNKQYAQIIAVSDITKEKTEKAKNTISKWQKASIYCYNKSEESWREMVKREDIDLVIIATPWRMHTPMSLFSMEKGKHVACEVPIAYTLEDCWKLIKTAETTRRHCIMIENCCYNQEELWILNMIQEGIFGDITHTEGAYLHDLRALLLDENYYQDQWRLKQHAIRNGNFYTTHALGPICHYLGIGRGDNFCHLTSMSSRELNLSLAAKQAKHKIQKYKCGDINNTIIKTKKGKTILLQFDVHTGRPYSRINKIIGTNAMHEGYPSRLYIDSKQPKSWGHNWLNKKDYKKYRKKYQHPIIKKLETISQEFKQGHGGMDFIMIYRLIRCLNLGLPLDINIYDSVMWSAITPLSELSANNKSQTIDIPDFTNGKWKEKENLEIMRQI
tara:strand:+ start:2016 stop:3404 length:1389 start_codon:yes stop_codon:yes gene_type:complete